MILVVGLSYRTAPVEVRERLSAGADALPVVLSRLAARHELTEVMFLSTCNRVEVVARGGKSPRAAVSAIREELAAHGGVSAEDLAPHLYVREGEEAITHVFRVAASLDSMVLGEPQILGQVKDAHDAAVAAGTLKGPLARCVSRAFAVAKRVRNETAIGAGTVSISSVAVGLANHIFGGLSDRVVLLLGAGEMAEQAARSLGKGARALRICNRSFDRAAALAGAMHASAVPWEQLEQELATADVVVASTASRVPVVTRDMVRRAMRARKGKTLLFVDIAVPRNVEPGVHNIDNVYAFDIDDLEHEVARGMKARHAQLAAAEEIVGQEVAAFLAWRRGTGVQSTIVAMRAKARAVLFAELDVSLRGKLKHLPEADRAALTQAMESAVNKLLHAPTTRLRARAIDGEDAAELAATVTFLFDLQELAADPDDEEEEEDTEADGGPGGKDGGEGLPN
jgi:glutamyl-tRNA reductase